MDSWCRNVKRLRGSRTPSQLNPPLWALTVTPDGRNDLPPFKEDTLQGKAALVVRGHLVTLALNASMTEVSKLLFLHVNLNFPR